MKIGLKSSLLPRLFPISCSAEFQSCSLAPWRHFWGTVDYAILEEAASCCEEQNGHSGVKTSLRTCKSREVTSTEEEKALQSGAGTGAFLGEQSGPWDWPSLGGRGGRRQRSEKGASLCRDQQPAPFSQGCPPRRMTWKSMAQSLCSTDLQPWGWDGCS